MEELQSVLVKRGSRCCGQPSNFVHSHSLELHAMGWSLELVSRAD